MDGQRSRGHLSLECLPHKHGALGVVGQYASMPIKLRWRKSPRLQYFQPCGVALRRADRRITVHSAELGHRGHEGGIIEARTAPTAVAAHHSQYQEKRNMAEASHLAARLSSASRRVKLAG